MRSIMIANKEANIKVVMAEISSRSPNNPTNTRQGAPKFMFIRVTKSVGKVYSFLTQIKPISEMNNTGETTLKSSENII